MKSGSPPAVVYIGGYRRSGSTLLGILLGEVREFVHVGEVSFLNAELSSGDRTACACGKAPKCCSFWRPVLHRYREHWPGAQFDDSVWKLQRSMERRRAVLTHITAAAVVGRGRFQTYRRHVRNLFQAIAEKASASVVVDSSKCTSPGAWRPILLSRVGNLNVRLIHLVRDGRGVMWSARKGSNRSLEIGAKSKGKDQLRSWSALIGWTISNLVTWIQRKILGKENSLVIHYEDLASDPVGELTRIGRWLQADVSNVLQTLASDSAIPPDHAVGGNRMRKQGISQIRPDTEWKQSLPTQDHILYRFATLSRVESPPFTAP